MLQGAAEKLRAHFRLLKAERVDACRPIYALEHGLSPAEVDDLRRELSDNLKAHRRLRGEHWLLWLVIAAEVGYNFDGNEYWISFGNLIPSWRHFGDRNQIRQWFRSFEEQLGGYHPKGRWSQHFSIIAWPVAHAILPRDLQVQFAHYLFVLRYELAKLASRPPSEIGSLLQRFTPTGSSRFHNFLQQSEVASCLVLALRDEDINGEHSAIYHPTLKRIVSDLEQWRNARGWLRDARRVLRDVRFVGAGGLQGQGGAGSFEPSLSQAKAHSTPRLCATRSASGGWTLGVWIPDLRALLARSDMEWRSLDRLRVRFADRPDAWLPARSLEAISESQQRIRSIADISGGPLFVFDRDAGVADQIFSNLRVEGSSPWLLRVEADGVARQIKGNHVRAGENYLLITSSTVTKDIASVLSLRRTQCSDSSVASYELCVATTLSGSFNTALQKLSLGYSLKASVRPLGLVPRAASSTDGTIWLADEEPLLELSAQFAVRGFLLQLDQSSALQIGANDSRAVVSLGKLHLGQHDLRVTAIPEGGAIGQARHIEALKLTLFVRSPAPWLEDIRSRAGIRVNADPQDASLSDLAEGRAAISILGPAGRETIVELRAYDINGHFAQSQELGKLTLPVDAKTMRRFIRRAAFDKISDKLQSYPRVDIAFIAGELGVATISTFQEVVALRWAVENAGQDTIVRLVDESGSEVPPVIRSFQLTKPDADNSLRFEDCVRGIKLESPGNLLCVTRDGHDCAAIVSVANQGRISSFSELGLNISLSSRSNSLHELVRLIGLTRLWTQARPYGPLAATRRAAVLQELRIGIARITCGTEWAEQLKRCRDGRRNLLDDLKKQILGHYTGFSTRMSDESWILGLDSASRSAAFVAHARTYKICMSPEVGALAMQLAFNPEQVTTASPETSDLLGLLAAHQRLVRGAHFAKLIFDLAEQDLHSSEVAA